MSRDDFGRATPPQITRCQALFVLRANVSADGAESPSITVKTESIPAPSSTNEEGVPSSMSLRHVPMSMAMLRLLPPSTDGFDEGEDETTRSGRQWDAAGHAVAAGFRWLSTSYEILVRGVLSRMPTKGPDQDGRTNLTLEPDGLAHRDA